MKPTPWTPDVLALAKALNQKGLSASKIAAEINKQFGTTLTRNSIVGKFHRDGIPFQSATQSVRNRAALRTYRAAKKRCKPAKVVALPKPKKTDVVLPPARGTGRDAVLLLQVSDCRYPVGDPKDSAFRFCGLHRRGGSSYCEAHHNACMKGE